MSTSDRGAKKAVGAQTAEGEIEHDRGQTDEDSHGWSPDVEGAGPAKEAAIKGHKKAFDPDDTQAASKAPEGGFDADPDAPPEGVGESITRRGEDVAKAGKGPGYSDAGTQGPSERPVGKGSGKHGVDPQDPIEEDMPDVQKT